MGLFRSSIAALAVGAVCSAAHAATMFMGAYPNTILVINEDTGTVTDRISLATGVPRGMELSKDKSKIFVTTEQNSFEVIDVATHKELSHFDLNTPPAAEALAFATQRSHVATRYRISGGGVVDPTGKFFYATLVQIDKGLDRYTVSKPRYAVISLDEHKVIRWRDVDEEEEQATANAYRTSMALSDDGKYLYIFRNKVVVLDTADLKVVDRIDLAESEVSDLDAATFGPALESISQAGEFVSLFDAADPYIHNRLFGIGRFKLATREFSFTPIGPAPTTMQGVQVAPDGKTAYAVAVNGTFGNKRCEFWRFDLPTNSLQAKAEFPCRTRFSFGISANGQQLYIYGASFDIEVYDAKTLKHERTWNLNDDVTGAMVTVGR